METVHQLLQQETWRIIDQTTYGANFEAYQSFAIDDTICQSVAQETVPPTLRTWIHEQTVVLGIQDSRMPNINEAMNYLRSQGYRVIVRNSGGLAVVLDKGILNLSLILSEKRWKIDINTGYEAMFQLIQHILGQYDITIEAREIEGSYCPGNYDLSIANKKFAGISQRRVRGGVAVQIYLGVTGSGSKRAELIKQFYTIGTDNYKLDTSSSYPIIQPNTMATLTELITPTITTQEIITNLYRFMSTHSREIIQSQLDISEIDLYKSNLQKIITRSNKALGKIIS